MVRFILYFVCIINLFYLVSCDGCSSKKRGRKARQEVEETRTKETSSIADKYAKIDKACNRIEVIVDTLSAINFTEIDLVRKEISMLRIESKDIASDYEAAKLSRDVQKEFIHEGIDYMLISNLSSRTEKIHAKFIQKFGSN
jgi:hypothetical protein